MHSACRARLARAFESKCCASTIRLAADLVGVSPNRGYLLGRRHIFRPCAVTSCTACPGELGEKGEIYESLCNRGAPRRECAQGLRTSTLGGCSAAVAHACEAFSIPLSHGRWFRGEASGRRGCALLPAVAVRAGLPSAARHPDVGSIRASYV